MATSQQPYHFHRIHQLTADLLQLTREEGCNSHARAMMKELALLLTIEVIERMESRTELPSLPLTERCATSPPSQGDSNVPVSAITANHQQRLSSESLQN
jgi:hypothetical protein